MESKLITVSRMRAFNSCRRLHQIKYELGYRSTQTSAALSFGSLIHAGLEAWWGHAGEGARVDAALAAMTKKAAEGTEIDAVTLAKAEVLICGYDQRWLATMEDFETIGVELEFRAPLRNPATGYPMRELEVAGKLDALIRKRSDGTVWIVEHKTSSDDLSAGSTYWQRLRMDPQVSVYYDGAKSLGHEVAGCIYDVLSKFRETPKLATPMDKRRYTKKDGKLDARQRENDETLDEFRARLTASMIESPDGFFGRADVIRTDAELEESARDTHETALMIRDCSKRSRAPRNPDACFLYHRVCEFHGVCSGCDALDNQVNFQKKDSIHSELSAENQ